MFFNRQVLVKVAPGANLVPSGTVTSVTNCTHAAGLGFGVLVGGTAVAVAVGTLVGTIAVCVGGTVVAEGAVVAEEAVVAVACTAWVAVGLLSCVAVGCAA